MCVDTGVFSLLVSNRARCMEAGSPPKCRSVHWTVSPQGSHGLDSALTRQGQCESEANSSCPCRYIRSSSEGSCQCGLASLASQPRCACSPFWFSLLVAGLLGGQSCAVCKAWGCLASDSLLWRRVIDDRGLYLCVLSSLLMILLSYISYAMNIIYYYERKKWLCF